MAKKMTQADLLAQMQANMTPSQLATIKRMTGADAQQGGNATPKIVVNYNGKADTTSKKKIAKGNFVMFQEVNYVSETDKTLVEAGIDLGSTLEATLLMVGTQYSFFPNNKSQIQGPKCSSQICLDNGEVAVGTCGLACVGGNCPRRKTDVAKDDKCSNQFVTFWKLPEGTVDLEGNPVEVGMMYIKGINYMAFKDYLKTLKAATGDLGFPAVTTVLTTEDQDTYYDIISEVGQANVDTYLQLIDMVTALNKDVLEFKAQHAVPQIEAPKASGEQADPWASADTSSAPTVVVEPEVLGAEETVPF